MKLTLLGTGSCEGIPFLWCDCRICTLARENGGYNQRARTALAVNNDILVDFGPDMRMQCLKYSIDTPNVRHLAITHSHADHFQPFELAFRTQEYAKNKLNIIASTTILDQLRPCAANANLNLVQAIPGQWIDCHDGYRFFPVKATHCGPDETALNYIIEDYDRKRLLVAADTGWYCQETFRQLAGLEADAAVIEMSFGIRPPYDTERAYHLGAQSTIDLKNELVHLKALKTDAFTAATHISHCSNCTHEEITEFFRGTGIVPGYDGMKILV